MQAKPKTIDDYLSGVADDDKRQALTALRSTLRALLPGAEECISYNIPAFRLDGEVMAGFLATAKGCSYFPFSSATLSTLKSELAGFELTKGSLHFSPQQPLSPALVKRLVATRRAETQAASKAKKTSTKKKKKAPTKKPAAKKKATKKPATKKKKVSTKKKASKTQKKKAS